MTQAVEFYPLTVGLNQLRMPVDSTLLRVGYDKEHFGVFALCDATGTNPEVARNIHVVGTRDLIPDPVGVYVGSAVKSPFTLHAFDVTETV